MVVQLYEYRIYMIFLSGRSAAIWTASRQTLSRGFFFVLNLMASIFTPWVLLTEMLGAAILLILESDVIFVTAPTGHLLYLIVS